MTDIYAKALFIQHGFAITDTGGGSRAWHKTVTGSRGTFHALVTDEAGDNLPDYADIVATIHKDADTGAIGDSEALWDDSFTYAAECLAELLPSLNYYVGGDL